MDSIMNKLITEGVVTPDISEQIKESFDLKVSAEVARLTESKIQELEEEYQNKIDMLEGLADEYMQEQSNQLAEKVNDYLELVVSSWIKENEEKINKLVESERVEAMSEGLKALMITSGITMQEIEESLEDEKKEEIEESTRQKEDMEKLAEENIALRKERDNLLQLGLFNEATADLSLPQKERVEKLSEDFEFTKEKGNKYLELLENIKSGMNESVNESTTDSVFNFSKVQKTQDVNKDNLIFGAKHLYK